VKLPPSLFNLLRAPTAAAAWDLRAELLGLGVEPTEKAFRLLADFYRYLERIETGAASQGHSERASKMEIGSLSGVVGADLAEAEDSGEWARRLLSATITEGLAVMATRQHVKAWRGELDSVHREAAWFLYDEFWTWASCRKPDLDPAERRQLLDQLMAPIHDDKVPSGAKQLILCSLFVLLLVDSLATAVES